MTTTTQAPDAIYGYDVIDSAGNKIGTVDNIWVDDATNALEFVGVKTGWLFGKTHVIPVENAQIDNGSNAITVPFDQDQIKNAPSYSSDAELSPDDENTIYDYYGMQRNTQASPTGLATGGPSYDSTNYTDTTDYAGTTDTTGYATTTDQNQINVPLTEEQVQVGKQQQEAGRVRLRKVVRTEHEEVPVELRREQVTVERVPADGTTVPDSAFQEQEIDVPVMEEEAVVSKTAQVTGQVQVNKMAQTETQTVGTDVQREDVEVIEDDDTDVVENRTNF